MEPFNLYFLDTVQNRYAQFTGRATRSEFWYFMLFSMIISIILSILDGALGTGYTYDIAEVALETTSVAAASVTTEQTIGYMSTLYSFTILIPTIAVSIRRLHDSGKSGWWLLIGIIPIVNFIGIFVLIYFYIKDSQPDENNYGENPKAL